MTLTWRETDTEPSEVARWYTRFDGNNHARMTRSVLLDGHRKCRTALEEDRYRTDRDQHGVADLWLPVELEDPDSKGDCEDFALGFMLWCARQGVPPGAMRMLVGLKRKRDGLRVWREGHAVVLIRTTEGGLISDIEAPAIFTRSRIFNTRLSAYRFFRPAAEAVDG